MVSFCVVVDLEGGWPELKEMAYNGWISSGLCASQSIEYVVPSKSQNTKVSQNHSTLQTSLGVTGFRHRN